LFVYVINKPGSLSTTTVTIAMADIQSVLDSVVRKTSDENYEGSFDFYRFWLDIGQTYHQIPDLVLNTILNNRATSLIHAERGELIHPTAHLLLRFANDVESDPILDPHNAGLQSRLCARILQQFFSSNLEAVLYKENNWGGYDVVRFYADANLIARWANLGFVEEAAICNHILQSLISHPKLYDHQANALVILFKLAGATFEAYAGTSVVDHCFKLLKDNYSRDSVLGKLVKVSASPIVKGGHRAQASFQEVVALRERGWEALPPPPMFATDKPKPTSTNQKDPAKTPVTASLGLPSRDLASQSPQSPPLEPVVTPEPGTIPEYLVPQSPSISVSTLSDFTIADTFDDEPPLDPTAIHPHDTFYLEDGNVEVLCDSILFRVQASALSFHSPVLGQLFAKANLATAESPNGCPRIPSSDSATDFATLLKIVYLPAYATLSRFRWIVPLTILIYRFPERNKVPDFTTFSSLLRITAKYEMSAVRSQILDIVRNAYPETFEGLDSSKVLGERVFSGPTPHPNAVLNLFVQQKLKSALPMAYYMAVRRGPDSLMDRHLPRDAILSPEILQVAIKGLLALREMELKEIHRLIFGSNNSRSCPWPGCPSPDATGPRISEAHRKIADRITDSAHSGTRLLQVLSLREVCGGDYLGFCKNCVEGWEVGHADVRRNAWEMLPDVFGLKG
jgi:hypothetical protein